MSFPLLSGLLPVAAQPDDAPGNPGTWTGSSPFRKSAPPPGRHGLRHLHGSGASRGGVRHRQSSCAAAARKDTCLNGRQLGGGLACGRLKRPGVGGRVASSRSQALGQFKSARAPGPEIRRHRRSSGDWATAPDLAWPTVASSWSVIFGLMDNRRPPSFQRCQAIGSVGLPILQPTGIALGTAEFAGPLCSLRESGGRHSRTAQRCAVSPDAGYSRQSPHHDLTFRIV